MASSALSTFVVTPFAIELHGMESRAIQEAQEIANRNECPCGVWARDGWYTVCELAPEMIEPDPELFGWRLHAVVDPYEI